MKGEGGEFIPEQRAVGAKVYLTMNGQIKKSGFYDLFLNADRVNHTYAFNYNRRESALQYYTADELSARLGAKVNVISALDTAVLTAQIQENNQGTVLWRWCIILALLFLGIEILLLRFWKV
jgi:acetate kinase